MGVNSGAERLKGQDLAGCLGWFIASSQIQMRHRNKSRPCSNRQTDHSGAPVGGVCVWGGCAHSSPTGPRRWCWGLLFRSSSPEIWGPTGSRWVRSSAVLPWWLTAAGGSKDSCQGPEENRGGSEMGWRSSQSERQEMKARRLKICTAHWEGHASPLLIPWNATTFASKFHRSSALRACKVALAQG